MKILLINTYITLLIIGCSFSAPKEPLPFSSLESMKKQYLTYKDSIGADSNWFYLVNERNSVPFEILVFDSAKNYHGYLMYASPEKPAFGMVVDSSLNVKQKFGSTSIISFKDCQQVSDTIVNLFTILPITPPFFKTEIDIYSKQDLNSDFVLARQYQFKDDLELSYMGKSFKSSTHFMLTLKFTQKSYSFTDTVYFSVETCAN